MIFEKIRAALAAQFELPPEDITEATDIVADLGADSLDLVELITFLEDQYDIVITDERIYGCKTVGEIAEFMRGLIGE